MGKERSARMYGNYPPETFSAHGQLYRRCVFCGEVKAVSAFHRNGTNAEGHPEWRQDCKLCYSIRRKENKTKKKHSDFICGQKRRGEEQPSLSHQEWKEALIFFGGECAFCGGSPRKGQRLTRDHITPISVGGKTVQSNIVPACPSCNSSKGAEELKKWYTKQPFFSKSRLDKVLKWQSITSQVEGGVKHG